MQIGRKIYYDITTGNVLLDTGERSGTVVETTREQDFETYVALSERLPETVGCIQLEYGELFQDFSESVGYSVDVSTEEIIFSYPEPDTEQPPYTPPQSLGTMVTELQAENETLRVQLAQTNADLAAVLELILLGL